MPITVFPIANPALELDPHDFQSVTEYRDLPRKFECLDDEGNSLYGTDSTYWCQDGCKEKPFQYIVEPGDFISLQFRAADTLNTDPTVPIYGWRETGPTFLLELEALSLAGDVLWSGDISEVASDWYVAHDDVGPIQAVTIEVDRLLEEIGVDCFYFRVRVVLGVGEYNSANSDHAPGVEVDYGYRYIDLVNGRVMEYNGAAFVQIGPTTSGEVWYSADNGIWYQWDGLGWAALIDPPSAGEGGNTDDYLTMSYRVRRCDEPIVEFASVEPGIDCLGITHVTPRPEYVMDPIEGLRTVDYFSTLPNDHPTNLALPEGTTFLNPNLQSIQRRTAYAFGSTSSPWEFILPMAGIGDRFLVMHDGGGYTAGDVIERTANVPFVGYWALAGTIASLYPGEVFTNDTVDHLAFQHSFKVSGSAEIDQLPIEREVTENGRLVRRTSERRVRVRTTGMPEVVAMRVQAVLAAPSFTINGESYTDADGLRKNNDEGSHWWLDFSVGRVDCDADATCD